LIHSEFFNSEWKSSLWPLRVGNPFPVFVSIAFYLIVSHSVLRYFRITVNTSVSVRYNPLFHSPGAIYN